MPSRRGLPSPEPASDQKQVHYARPALCADDGDFPELGRGRVVRCGSPLVGVHVDHDARQLIAVRAITEGTRLFVIEGRETSTPTKYSVQIGPALHLAPGVEHQSDQLVMRYYWCYLNHHCEPNTALCNRELIALRNIAPGEGVAFDYNTTEYDIASPFACRCGSASCVGTVRGARYITAEHRARILPILAAYLR